MCRAFHPAAVSVSRELPSEGQQVQTQLHRSCSEDFYAYHNVPWKIYIRKEVWGGTGGGQAGVKALQGERGLFAEPLWVSFLAGFLPQGQHQQPAAARPHLPAGEALSRPQSPPRVAPGAGVSPCLGCPAPPSPDLQRHALRHLHPHRPGGAAPLEIPLR